MPSEHGIGFNQPRGRHQYVSRNNLAHESPDQLSVTIVAETNPAVVVNANAAPSNSLPVAAISSSLTNDSATNLSAVFPTNAIVSGTNIAMAKMSGGTNVVGDSARTNSTNAAIAKASTRDGRPTRSRPR